MSAEQQLVAAGGATLLGLYLWSSGGAHAIYQSLSTGYKDHPGSVDDAAHAAVVAVGKSLLGIAAATLIAGASDGAGRMMLALVAGLLVLWLINQFGGASAPNHAKAPSAKITPGPGVAGGRHPVTA